MVRNTSVIYIDCTETYVLKLNTGIQRVVKNIANHALTMPKTGNYAFVPVVCMYGEFYELTSGFHNNVRFTRYATDIFAAMKNICDRIVKLDHFTVAKNDHGNNADSSSLQRSYLSFLGMCREIMPFIFKMTLKLDKLLLHVKEVNFKDGDVLFISDVFWKSYLYKGVLALREIKLIKLLMVYDVIALTHPNCVENMNCIDFEKFYFKFSEIIDGVITISSYSMDQIKACTNSGNTMIAYDYFHLGADFTVRDQKQAVIREEIRHLCDGNTYYLAVGTVEPRKNYSFILDAFEELWRDGYEGYLCIAGKVGWKCDDVMSRIRTLATSGGRVCFFADLNDEELEYCYRRAKALIIASVVEGFGLPLVEAMHNGIPVLASDIPVFREVAHEYPLYFDLVDPSCLMRIISDFETGKIAHDFMSKNWISWNESMQNLFGKIERMVDEIKQRQENSENSG